MCEVGRLVGPDAGGAGEAEQEGVASAVGGAPVDARVDGAEFDVE